MSKLLGWFYQTALYYKFRYYFIRKKAPLSWILWGELLRRESISVGMYQISVAAANYPDCAISLSRGAPGENRIDICVYDSRDKLIDTVSIHLGYRSMGRVIDGFDRAYSISRKKVREENKHGQPKPQ